MWFKYHSCYFKIVSNFPCLTAREITYNNFKISLVVFMPNVYYKSPILILLLLIFPVTSSKIKIKTVQQIKSKIWEIKESKCEKTLAKI